MRRGGVIWQALRYGARAAPLSGMPPWMLDRANDSHAFCRYVQHVLAQTLGRRDVFLGDLPAHKSSSRCQLSAHDHYLPPTSCGTISEEIFARLRQDYLAAEEGKENFRWIGSVP